MKTLYTLCAICVMCILGLLFHSGYVRTFAAEVEFWWQGGEWSWESALGRDDPEVERLDRAER